MTKVGTFLLAVLALISSVRVAYSEETPLKRFAVQDTELPRVFATLAPTDAYRTEYNTSIRLLRYAAASAGCAGDTEDTPCGQTAVAVSVLKDFGGRFSYGLFTTWPALSWRIISGDAGRELKLGACEQRIAHGQTEKVYNLYEIGRATIDGVKLHRMSSQKGCIGSTSDADRRK